eukprot:gene19477-23156_t
MLVKVDRPNPSLLKGADYIGMALMAVFLGCLEYTLEEGPRWNWFSDSTISTTAWIAAISGGLFIWRCLEIKEPIVDLRALRDRNFALGCLFSFITGIGIFATIYLTPLFLGRVRGYGSLDIGLAVFSTGVFQLLAIPVYALLANRFDLRWILMFGLSLFALSMWDFSPITHDWGAKELLLPQAIRGFQLSGNAQLLGQNSLDSSQFALSQLWALTWREAQTLTYADAFLMIMVCFVVAVLL